MSIQITKTLDDISTAFDAFKVKQDERIDALVNEVASLNDELAGQKSIRSGNGGGASPASKARFTDFVRTGEPMVEGKSMSVGIAADGGHAVPIDISNVIRDQLIDISPMRRVCRTETSQTGDYRINVGLRGLASGWVGETALRPVTASPQMAQVTPPIGEVYANTKVTQHLLDDANFGVASYVMDHMVDEFSLQESIAFITGDGTDKPEGFLTRTLSANDDAARTFGELQYRATGVAGGFAATDPQDDLIDLVYSVRPSYRQGEGVAWLMNASTASVVRKMKDNEGRFLWQDSLQAGQPDRLLGHMVVIAEDMPAMAADSLSVAFGNWRRGYTIVDRVGMRMLRDPYTEKGHVLFYGTKRVGGSVVDSDAIKILKFGVS